MATTYSEKVVFSINILMVKNLEYHNQIKAIIDGVQPLNMDFEKYVVDTDFGNKIVKASIVRPDVTRIAVKNVKDLVARIQENNAAIREMISQQPAYEMSESEIADMIAELNNERNVTGVRFELGSNSPIGERIFSAAGKTVTPGVGEPGTSDFDAFPVFQWRLCNRANGEVVAYEGDDEFDPVNLDTFVEVPMGYTCRYITETHEYFLVSDRPFMGSRVHRFFRKGSNFQTVQYIAAYKSSFDSVSKHESKSGKLPDVGITRAQSRTYSRNRGDYASVQDVHARDWVNLLMMVEFGRKDIYDVLGKGCTEMAYSSSHAAVVSETGVNKVILLNAYADAFVVGQEISIGTALANNSIAADRTITAIDAYDASNKAITFSGSTTNITAGNVVWSSRQRTGKSDAVGSGTGRAVGVDGKCSFRYRGLEDPYGNVAEFVDNLNVRDGRPYSDSKGRINLYSDTDFGDNYDYHENLMPASNGYIKRLAYDEDMDLFCLPLELRGSSSTYYCDYYTQSSGERVARIGGDVNDASETGPWSWSLNLLASSSGITTGSRMIEVTEGEEVVV